MSGENEPMFDTRGHVRHERQAARDHIAELALAWGKARRRKLQGETPIMWDVCNMAEIAMRDAVDAYLAKEKDGQ